MSFGHVFGDPVLLVLAATSLVSWALIVQSILALRAAGKDDRALARLTAEFERNSKSDREQVLIVMDTAIVLERHRLERSLPLLGVIGSTAPYVGLFGTVIGIIRAFQAIQAQNNMSPSVVAGGIALALVATAMGLAVAIPAVAAHHLLAAAVTRRVAVWESVIAEMLGNTREAGHEPVARA